MWNKIVNKQILKKEKYFCRVLVSDLGLFDSHSSCLGENLLALGGIIFRWSKVGFNHAKLWLLILNILRWFSCGQVCSLRPNCEKGEGWLHPQGHFQLWHGISHALQTWRTSSAGSTFHCKSSSIIIFQGSKTGWCSQEPDEWKRFEGWDGERKSASLQVEVAEGQRKLEKTCLSGLWDCPSRCWTAQVHRGRGHHVYHHPWSTAFQSS